MYQFWSLLILNHPNHKTLSFCFNLFHIPFNQSKHEVHDNFLLDFVFLSLDYPCINVLELE